jgi:hypothetical protein
MEDIFVEIEWNAGTPEGAVERAKAIMAREGWSTGGFQAEQGEANSVAGVLEVQEGLYDEVSEGEGAWEATDGVVTVRFECP